MTVLMLMAFIAVPAVRYKSVMLEQNLIRAWPGFRPCICHSALFCWRLMYAVISWGSDWLLMPYTYMHCMKIARCWQMMLFCHANITYVKHAGTTHEIVTTLT